MEYFKLILLLVFCVCIESKKCESGYKAIFCEYPSSGAKCKEFKERTLTDEEKNFIVEEHNRLRHQIATENGTSLPKAYFMKKLFWDNELADAAQKWAEQCGESFKDDDKLKYLIGANIAIAARSGKNTDLSRLINKWKSGLSVIDKSLIKEFQPQENENAQHLSQMIWAKTDKIGCGISEYKGRCRETVHNMCPLMELVCFYSPAGNVKGDPIYLTTENKDFICEKDISNSLCNKIIYKGERENNIKNMQLNEDLESDSFAKVGRNYKEYEVYEKIKRKGDDKWDEPTKVTTNCAVEKLVDEAGKKACVGAIKNLTKYWDKCKEKLTGEDKPDKAKDPGPLATSECEKDVVTTQALREPCKAAAEALATMWTDKKCFTLVSRDVPPSGDSAGKPGKSGSFRKNSNSILLISSFSCFLISLLNA